MYCPTACALVSPIPLPPFPEGEGGDDTRSAISNLQRSRHHYPEPANLNPEPILKP